MGINQPAFGIVAILDALGAASYTDAEIKRFLRSREEVISLLNEKSARVSKNLDTKAVTTFTFNDTVIIVLKIGKEVLGPLDIKGFLYVLRRFMVDSLIHGILFRGSLSIGSFYVNEKTNTIMGEAVTDAVAWYDKANWVGIVATPRCSIYVQKVLESMGREWQHLMVDYDVPLKDEETVRLKAVNWPKEFYVPSPHLYAGHVRPKQKLLELLSLHKIPFGVESKFNNTIGYFDYVVSSQKLTKISI